MIKHVIALVRLGANIAQELGRLVNFVFREDVQRLIATLIDLTDCFPLEKLDKAIDLTIDQLQSAPSMPESDPLHDAKYAEERIGVGEKTIYRLTKKGELPIARYLNRRRHFRESDIERCRRMYGRE